MIPDQRDRDLIQSIGHLQAQLDELRSVVVGRWGRVPTTPDAIPPDGALWIDQTIPTVMGRANGATFQTLTTGTTLDFTPTLLADTVNPNLGTTGTADGTIRIFTDFVWINLNFVWGGVGMTAGTGGYYVDIENELGQMPTTYAGNAAGTSRCVRNGQTFYPTPHMGSGVNSRITLRYQSAWPVGTDTVVGAASPSAWGVASDRISITLWVPTVL